jgi:hypothetical protein
MALLITELIFNDTPSKYNKDLVDFLSRNIETIIKKAKIQFKFKITRPDELEKLRQRGIKRLPAMIIDKQPYIGVPIIVEELRKRVKRSKTTAAPKSEEEVLQEYYISTLGNIKQDNDGKLVVPNDDDDDDDDQEIDLGTIFKKEMEKRGSNNKQQSKYTNRDNPQKPDRYAIQDDDYESTTPQTIQQKGNRPRMDNIDNNEDDPIATLNKMKPKNGEQAADDNMMRALLERMGSGSDFSV